MKYKILTISYLLLMTSLLIQAQEPEYETIFSKKAMRNFSQFRLYGIINSGYSPLKKNNKRYDYVSMGIDLGVTFKKQYSVGIFGTYIGEISTDFRPNYPIKPDLSTYIYQYGLSLTYTQKPQNAFHFFYNLKAGRIEVTELLVQKNKNFVENYQSSTLISPTVGAEMNLFPWLAVNAGLGYRWVSPKTALGLDFGKDLQGSTLQVGIKIGNIR